MAKRLQSAVMSCKVHSITICAICARRRSLYNSLHLALYSVGKFVASLLARRDRLAFAESGQMRLKTWFHAFHTFFIASQSVNQELLSLGFIAVLSPQKEEIKFLPRFEINLTYLLLTQSLIIHVKTSFVWWAFETFLKGALRCVRTKLK